MKGFTTKKGSLIREWRASKDLSKRVTLFFWGGGLCCCTRAFSSCSERGLLFVVVLRPLIAVASLAAEHGL